MANWSQPIGHEIIAIQINVAVFSVSFDTLGQPRLDVGCGSRRAQRWNPVQTCNYVVINGVGFDAHMPIVDKPVRNGSCPGDETSSSVSSTLLTKGISGR